MNFSDFCMQILHNVSENEGYGDVEVTKEQFFGYFADNPEGMARIITLFSPEGTKVTVTPCDGESIGWQIELIFHKEGKLPTFTHHVTKTEDGRTAIEMVMTDPGYQPLCAKQYFHVEIDLLSAAENIAKMDSCLAEAIENIKKFIKGEINAE